MTSPHRTFTSESELRLAAIRIAQEACNGAIGRVLGDPVFERVTEGRARWRKYSACGDLAHYVLKELGVTDERIVNRNDDGGGVPWVMGKNLSRIVYCAVPAFVWARGGRSPQPGDILYVASPEHVCVLERIDETKGKVFTFDYGLWDYVQAKPAGRRVERAFGKVDKHTTRIGSRILRGWLDLAKIPGLLGGQPQV
jgi:hypothetical protein